MDNRMDDLDTNSGLITGSNPRITGLSSSLDRILEALERMAASCKTALNGERYFTDKELSETLKVSRRTLQEWRNNGQIAYIQVCNKVLYRQSDIQTMLEKQLRKAWK